MRFTLPYISLILLLTSCASYENITNQKRDKAEQIGQDEVNTALNHTPKSKKYKAIRFTERLYMPELKEEEKNKPQWSMPVS